MFHYILEYSKDRISSLQSFYQIQSESINKMAIEGMKENVQAYMLYSYLSKYIHATEEERSSEQFLKIQKWASKYVDIVEKDDTKKISFTIKENELFTSDNYYEYITNGTKKYRQYIDMPIIHSGNTLVMLIARYEDFISGILKEIFTRYPNVYLNNRQLTYADIKNMSAEEIEDILVEKAVAEKMFERHENWFKIFKEHGMKFSACQKELGDIIEIYERRNLVVHNSGMVNSNYLQKVPSSTKKVGEALVIDDAYLDNAFSTILIIEYVVTIEAIKLLPKEDRISCYERISAQIFTDLKDKKYHICEKIYRFLSDFKEVDLIDREMAHINCWIAQKNLYGFAHIREDVASYIPPVLEDDEDSTNTTMLLIGKSALLEDYKLTSQLLEKVFDGVIGFDELESWPIFENYRQNREYRLFCERHKLGVESIVIENDTKLDGGISTELGTDSLFERREPCLV